MLKQINNNIVDEKEKEHMPLSKDQLDTHASAKTCSRCNKHFNNNKKSKYYKNFEKVKHHSFYAGLYAGATHALCVY